MSRFLRQRGPDEEQHASNLELFYDLVFVLAVTQVSHLLLDDLTWRGGARATLVLLVVWWAWNYTTWVTNMLDPDSVVVRLLVLAIMFASLLMAVAIPEAFGSRALLFAGAYVAIQVGRHRSSPSSWLRATRPSGNPPPTSSPGSSPRACSGSPVPSRRARCDRAGLVALGIDYVAPLVLYRVPGRPRLDPSAVGR